MKFPRRFYPSTQILAYIFCALNFLFVVFGLASLIIGAWLYGTKSNYIYLLSHDFGALSASTLCVLIGIAVLTIAVIGFCGLWFENRNLILTYVLFTSVVLLVEIVVSIMMFLYKKDVTLHVEQQLLDHFRSNNVSDFNNRALFAVDMTWDDLQRELKCCGLANYTDWHRDRRRWPKNDWVPDSCCDLDQFDLSSPRSFDNCGKMMNPDLFYKQGCYKAFGDWLFNHFFVVGTVNVLMAIFQILAVLSGLLIFWHMRRRSITEAENPASVYNRCNLSDSEA